jgi:hypothetical protein
MASEEQKGVTSVRRALPVILVLLVAGCGRLLGDHVPSGTTPAGIKQITFEVVARNGQCEPSVLAADREGRALLITLRVTSVGKTHKFLIPGLNVRKTIPAGMQVSISVIADRSGIYEYACTSLPWIGPFTAEGKLAIR